MYKPTKRLRKKVSLLVAGGLGEPQIANVMGIARETLRKYYSDELMNGRASIQAELLDKLWSAADKGNVTAMKHLDMRMSGKVPLGINSGYVSKKKLAEEAARNAGGEHSEWGNDLRPPDTEIN